MIPMLVGNYQEINIRDVLSLEICAFKWLKTSKRLGNLFVNTGSIRNRLPPFWIK